MLFPHRKAPARKKPLTLQDALHGERLSYSCLLGAGRFTPEMLVQPKNA
jgi:hypothetical protein